MLAAGGTAVDAAVAAGFAAAVAEPTLSSLGGGGFLLTRLPDGREHLLDFFVDAPGRGLAVGRPAPQFAAVPVRFAGAVQVFYTGWGSVAVPGCLAGYLAAHERFGRLPLPAVVEPARRLAADGVRLDAAQGAIVGMLQQILTASPDGRAVFAPGGRPLAEGDVLRSPLLADLLADVGAGRVRGFDDPRVAGPLERVMAAEGGIVTAADLAAYEVVERAPLVGAYAGARLATNPPPSFGGSLVVRALAELDAAPAAGLPDLAEALVRMSERHGTVVATAPVASRGTTHVSVVDAEGGVAAMTTSNGSCSGRFVPGTGVQLNNVLGELDLHPGGFHSTPPGVRIGSMMAPTVVTTPGGDVVALGSGGSERIRSALACVLHRLLARGGGLADAVGAPRLHWDREVLQVEPGHPAADLEGLRSRRPLSVWTGRDLYFGGVHAVRRTAAGAVEAAGDDRRGGSVALVGAPGGGAAQPG